VWLLYLVRGYVIQNLITFDCWINSWFSLTVHTLMRLKAITILPSGTKRFVGGMLRPNIWSARVCNWLRWDVNWTKRITRSREQTFRFSAFAVVTTQFENQQTWLRLLRAREMDRKIHTREAWFFSLQLPTQQAANEASGWLGLVCVLCTFVS
jgi:hypothetical protein